MMEIINDSQTSQMHEVQDLNPMNLGLVKKFKE